MRLTGTLVYRHGRDEGYEAGTAEELGNKDGGIRLSLRIVYSLEALSKHAIITAALSEDSTPITAHSEKIFRYRNMKFRYIHG